MGMIAASAHGGKRLEVMRYLLRQKDAGRTGGVHSLVF
jgi:hypothetical protein